jgi:hypothetical protein
LGSDRELNALAGLELGLDEGADGVDGEEHEDSENETVEEVEAGVSQLFADGLDVHLGEGNRVEGSILVGTTDLAPFAGRANDGVLKTSN